MSFKIADQNKRFRRLGEKILKFRWFLIGALIALDVAAVIGMSKVEMNSSWDTWFFEDDPVMQAKERFEGIFGNSDGAGILVQANDVFAPDVLRMIRELGREIEDNVPYIDEVVSISEFEFVSASDSGIRVGNLVPDEIPEDRESIENMRKLAFSKGNLVNKLFSDDSKETWISVRLKEIPEDRVESKGKEPLYVVGQELNRILNQEKYKKYNLKETGMPVIAFDKMNYFQKECGRVVMLALLVALVVVVLFTRSLRGVMVAMATTLSAILVSYGFMGFVGVKVDLNFVTVPVYLALAVSIGYCIHILLFFRRRFNETGNRGESVLHGIEHTGWPLLFTALTTIGCMLSFNFVDITAIRWVGNASAAMIAVVYVFVLVLTPVLLSFGKDKEIFAEVSESSDRFDIMFDRFGHFVFGKARVILSLFAVLCAALIIGATGLKVDFDPFEGFGMKVPYIKRLYDITQTKTGHMYSYNLMIELGEKGKAKTPEQLKQLEKLEAEIHKLPLTKYSMSVMDILKDMNRTMHGGDEAYYKIPEDEKLISQLLLLYENSGGNEAEYWMDYDYSILRMQVAIDGYNCREIEREYGVIQDLAAGFFPGSKSGMTGTMVEGAVVNNYIARGQVQSFIIALFVIGILMMIVFRSVKAGLIGLIPNIAPVVVIGGVMGYLGYPLDMMSMTIIPMIMGIAVDDTIHFVNHIKFEVEEGHSYSEAIFHSYRKIGKALFMTTAILVITFSVYITSDVVMFKVLGFMVGLGLIAALLCDYMVTPLLISITKPFKVPADENVFNKTDIAVLHGAVDEPFAVKEMAMTE